MVLYEKEVQAAQNPLFSFIVTTQGTVESKKILHRLGEKTLNPFDTGAVTELVGGTSVLEKWNYSAANYSQTPCGCSCQASVPESHLP